MKEGVESPIRLPAGQVEELVDEKVEHEDSEDAEVGGPGESCPGLADGEAGAVGGGAVVYFLSVILIIIIIAIGRVVAVLDFVVVAVIGVEAWLGFPARIRNNGFPRFGQHGCVDAAEHHGGRDRHGRHQGQIDQVDEGEFAEKGSLGVGVQFVPRGRGPSVLPQLEELASAHGEREAHGDLLTHGP